MHIRLSKLSDARALARLHRSTIRSINSADYSPTIIRSWTSRSTAKRFRHLLSTCIRYVAIENEMIMGFGELIGESGEIHGMYVHKDWIGKGIGKKIFAKLENRAKKMGLTKLTLNSSITAKEFYEHCGCSVTKKIQHRLRNGVLMEAFRMEKILDLQSKPSSSKGNDK